MGILVTGMHRSGTSLVASFVADTGLTLGEGAMLPANAANPTGYFERGDILDVNQRLLGRLGGTWWAPPAVSAADVRDVTAELDQVRTEVDVLAAPSGPWYLKDPRFAVLLPIWDRLALQALPVVACLRDPMAVAQSLALRDGMSRRRGLALWFEYTARLLTHGTGRPSLLLEFDQVVDRTDEAVWAIHDFVIATGHAVHPGWMPSTSVGRCDPALRRNTAHECPSDLQPLLDDCRELFDAARKLHGGAIARSGAITSPAWVQEAIGEALELWQLETRPPVIVDQGLAQAERDAWSAEAIVLRAQHQQAQDAVTAWQAVAESRLQEILRIRADWSAAQGQLTEQAAEREANQQLLASTSAELAQVQAELAEVQAALAQGAAELAATQRERDRLAQGLDGLAEDLTAVRASRAFRRGSRLFGRPRRTEPSLAGEFSLVAASGYFDRDWYLATYSDVVDAGIDPLAHFCLQGWREGRDPGPSFSTSRYLAAHPDVAAAGMNPLVHYLRMGWTEGRSLG